MLRAAVSLADEGGLKSLTMRRLAESLDAEAMSLYYHVANKEELLDGVAEFVVQEINDVVDRIDLPSAGADWKKAARQRILAAREVLLRHPWAPELLQTRTTAPVAVAKYFDGLLRLMRDGGFSYDLAHHGLHALGSRALGFSQELFNPGDDANSDDSAAMMENMAGQFPYLAGMLMEIVHDDPDSTLGWCDDQTEFEFGLDIVLDGLDRLRSER
ncbi:TetR family transcriptional regulator [Phytoactinopolyspora halotolerans]|uniref:TetR family transcriptional regulator n=1 Tax=Phytoactinopolyspora halotolerans TaxID=1981512 RepID=A0A6L9S7Q3_9ACTN|nr:TetR family transcriptional regulator [Phytoactinopolyspora halotolerans]